RLAQAGFDWIWMLSVWQTGPAGQRVSRSNPEWRREFEETLADLREEDIAGSGFAITGYTGASRAGRRRGARPTARAPAEGRSPAAFGNRPHWPALASVGDLLLDRLVLGGAGGQRRDASGIEGNAGQRAEP